MSDNVFPQEEKYNMSMNGIIHSPGIIRGGLTKKEYFAAMALIGLSVPTTPGAHNRNTAEWNQDKARHAVALAKALISELKD